jgi:tripartite ATP-independent transporter DctM subunit
MELPLLVLVIVFLLLLSMNVPIALAIGLSTFLSVVVATGSLVTGATIVAQQLAKGIESFVLLAVPFFILAGNLMGCGGLARRLIDLADAVFGRFRGGLGYVNIFSCMLFGSISGSAVAAVSGVGGFMVPEMKRKAYDPEFSVAVTTTAATTGLIIPPSNVAIVYALASGGVSIAAVFIAGLLPGILIGLVLMVVSGAISRRRGYGAGRRASWREVLVAFRRAVPSLLMVVIVLGGILRGYFTATEGAAVAVVYSFVLAVLVYREVRWRDLPRILLESSVTTSVVMLLVGTSMAMSWCLATQQVPQGMSASLISISENPLVILLIINLILLFVGTFMDITPAVLIFTPIFLPVVTAFGMDPVHFGIVMIANLCIGLCTPPVGTCLFVGCGVGKTSIARVSRPMLPFWGAMVIALMAITYWPTLSLWLVDLVGA